AAEDVERGGRLQAERDAIGDALGGGQRSPDCRADPARLGVHLRGFTPEDLAPAADLHRNRDVPTGAADAELVQEQVERGGSASVADPGWASDGIICRRTRVVYVKRSGLQLEAVAAEDGRCCICDDQPRGYGRGGNADVAYGPRVVQPDGGAHDT